MVTVALTDGNVIAPQIALTPVLNILSNAMGNAMAALINVEKSVLFLWTRQPHHTSTCARTSASTTPWPARANVQPQTLFSAVTDAWQTALLTTSTSVMGSASRVANPVMASVLRDTLTAAAMITMITIRMKMIPKVSVAARSTITSAMELAPQSLVHVMESVLRDG